MPQVKDKKSGLSLPSITDPQKKALQRAIAKAKLKGTQARGGLRGAVLLAQALAAANGHDACEGWDVGSAENLLLVAGFDFDKMQANLRGANPRAFEVWTAAAAAHDPSTFPTSNLDVPPGTSCKRVSVCWAPSVGNDGKTKIKRLKNQDIHTQTTSPEGRAGEGFLGLPVPLLTPGPQGIKTWRCDYVLARRADVWPSHTVRFEPTPGYPPELQERDYTRDENERQKIQRQVLDWRPAMVLNDDVTSQSGPPIVDRKWRVLGGNSRMIAINLLCETPQGASRYAAELRNALENHAMDWGLSTRVDLANLSDYVVVRCLQDEFNTATISNELNQGWTSALNVAGESVSCGKALPASVTEFLARAMGESDTIDQALEGANGRQVAQYLRAAGVITPQTQARWLRYVRGVYAGDLSRQGIDALRRCLVGAAVGSQDVLAHATPAVAAFLERIAPAWLSIFARVPAWRASFQLSAAELVEVLDYPAGQRHHRYAQGSLFGDAGERAGDAIQKDPVAVLLLVWMFCHRTKAKIAADQSLTLLRALGGAAGGLEGLLGVEKEDPSEALARVLGLPSVADVEDRGALPYLTRLEAAETCTAPSAAERAARNQERARRAAPPPPPPPPPPPAPMTLAPTIAQVFEAAPPAPRAMFDEPAAPETSDAPSPPSSTFAERIKSKYPNAFSTRSLTMILSPDQQRVFDAWASAAGGSVSVEGSVTSSQHDRNATVARSIEGGLLVISRNQFLLKNAAGDTIANEETAARLGTLRAGDEAVRGAIYGVLEPLLMMLERGDLEPVQSSEYGRTAGTARIQDFVFVISASDLDKRGANFTLKITPTPSHWEKLQQAQKPYTQPEDSRGQAPTTLQQVRDLLDVEPAIDANIFNVLTVSVGEKFYFSGQMSPGQLDARPLSQVLSRDPNTIRFRDLKFNYYKEGKTKTITLSKLASILDDNPPLDALENIIQTFIVGVARMMAEGKMSPTDQLSVLTTQTGASYSKGRVLSTDFVFSLELRPHDNTSLFVLHVRPTPAALEKIARRPGESAKAAAERARMGLRFSPRSPAIYSYAAAIERADREYKTPLMFSAAVKEKDGAAKITKAAGEIFKEAPGTSGNRFPKMKGGAGKFEAVSEQIGEGNAEQLLIYGPEYLVDNLSTIPGTQYDDQANDGAGVWRAFARVGPYRLSVTKTNPDPQTQTARVDIMIVRA